MLLALYSIATHPHPADAAAFYAFYCSAPILTQNQLGLSPIMIWTPRRKCLGC